jgi:plastocyanin
MVRALMAGALASLLSAGAAQAGAVSGRVLLAVESARLGDLGPTVVFLEGVDGGSPAVPEERLAIHQHNARFEPGFLVATVGQAVEMPNDDTIFHNVFSFSRPNHFDLGFYPAGELRSVRFAHAGLVKIYCSIHESMSGAVLVTPSPWYATASAAGRFRIEDVPAGRYRLTVWNEKLPPVTRVLEVGAAGARADVVVGLAAESDEPRRR